MNKASEIFDKTRSHVDPFLREANSRLGRFVVWVNEFRKKHLSERQFTYLLAIIVGFLSGIIAVFIKNIVHLVELVLTTSILDDYKYILYFVYPLIGILLAQWFINNVIRQKINHGIPNTLHAISQKNALIKKHNLYSSIVSAALTVGFGGSAGLEGPAVGTTSAWGANIGTLFKLPYKTRTLLIGCGAAGAMSALFNSPIAAIVFAIEVIMLDLTTASLIPLLLASASAAITSQLFLGDDILFHFKIRETFRIEHLPYYLGLGVFTGIASIHFFKAYTTVNGIFDRIKKQRTKTIIAGSILGLLIFLMPPLFGEGYNTINAIIEGRPFDVLENSLFSDYASNPIFLILFFLALGIFKVFATTLTFRAGGVGGTFAPTLFMGSVLGYFYATAINHFGLGDLPISNFVLVAMAGLMAGNLHAPLMAIFLIAEITGGYELFVPLMITSSIAFVTVKQFVPHSIYTTQLARRGELITHNKDAAVLTLMKLHREIETDIATVDPYSTLGELIKTIAKSHRNLFAVVDQQNNFIGVVNLNEIRNIIFKHELYDTTYVHDLMNNPPEYVRKEDTMDSVMQKFESSGAWNLPVLDDQGHYMGFVSKSKLFSAYRSMLKEFYSEV
ncbi:MAG: chloride channel protein [Salibacteraceae bacterium]|nr:chloride channel protein [Salibacteraceae bacterium]